MRRSLIVALALILVAGCGAAEAPIPVAPAMRTPAASLREAHLRSWMSRDAKKIDLLYVSDYQTDDVYAYSYPQGKLSGVLAGVLKDSVYPTGLCSDASGNVFIPKNADATVLEYPHGSTKPAHTLQDPNEYPYTCAVDAASGTLAVINLQSISGAGGVSMYRSEQGLPKIYTYPFVYFYYFGAFDASGNFFMDATLQVPSMPFTFVELPKGAKSLQPITLEQRFRAPGGVGWDGKHLTVADPRVSRIYRFTITGSDGVEVGSTRLQQGHFVAEYVVDGNRVAGANFNGASVMFWRYPAGGLPAKTIGGFGEPFGVALSRAAR